MSDEEEKKLDDDRQMIIKHLKLCHPEYFMDTVSVGDIIKLLALWLKRKINCDD